MKLEAVEITAGKQLHDYKFSWLELYQSSSFATPFQSPEWLIGWWDIFGNDSLRGIAFKQGEELVGLGLFFIYDSEFGRTLSFVGSGISDYLDILVNHRIADTVVPQIFDYIKSIESQWDICDLQQLRSSSFLLGDHANLQLFQSLISVTEVCPRIKLPESGTMLINQLKSKKLRRNIRSGTRRIVDSHEFCMEVASSDNVDSFLDDLFALHSKRWNLKQNTGVFSDRKVQQFHRKIVGGLVNNQELQMYRFGIDSSLCAVFYTLSHGNNSYGYISGFDPSLSKFSLGSICLFHTISDLIERNMYWFDFLRGSEEYKYGWGASKRYNYRLLLGHRRH